MKRVLLLSVILAPLWSLCVTAHGQGFDPGKLGYNGRYDNKSVADLDLMTPAELNHEASNVCFWVVSMKKQSAFGDAKEYIDTIGRVARKKNNGREPIWVAKVSQALFGGDSGACFWEDEPQRKTLAELEGMKPCGLYREAVGVCQTVYTYKRTSNTKAFVEYLNLIFRVAKRQAGSEPSWIARMREKQCPSANDKCPVASP